MPSAGAVGLGEMPLELRQFRYFVAVVEEGQVTRAARRLHMAQPALSQAIAQLERQVGVALLDRHARGVRPTAAGEAFLEKARSAVLAADEAEVVAEAWARTESGELAVGFLSVALVVAGPLLDDFRTRHPHVRLRLHELNFATQVRELRAGRLDAEIIAPARPIDGLDTIELHAAQRVVVMSAGIDSPGGRRWSSPTSRRSGFPADIGTCRRTGSITTGSRSSGAGGRR